MITRIKLVLSFILAHRTNSIEGSYFSDLGYSNTSLRKTLWRESCLSLCWVWVAEKCAMCIHSMLVFSGLFISWVYRKNGNYNVSVVYGYALLMYRCWNMFMLSLSLFKDTRYELLQILNFVVCWTIHLFKLFWGLWEVSSFIGRLGIYVLLGFLFV